MVDFNEGAGRGQNRWIYGKMFHVKHCPGLRNEPPSTIPSTPLWKTQKRTWPVDVANSGESPQFSTASFSDAEIPENDVENVVNINAASEATQGARREPQFLG